MSQDQIRQLAVTICRMGGKQGQYSFRKVVATLVEIGKEEDIPDMVRQGFRDDSLPMTKNNDDDGGHYHLYHPETKEECPITNSWTRRFQRSFWKASTKYNVPVFERPEGKIHHYIFPAPTVLPFQVKKRRKIFETLYLSGINDNDSDGSLESGGYAITTCVKIHESHHHFGDYRVCHQSYLIASIF